MERVKSAAWHNGYEYFEPSGRARSGGTEAIWDENRRWLEQAMGEWREIVDIGYDGDRPDRGEFYARERELVEGYPRRREMPWPGRRHPINQPFYNK